jgi:hypothetical protein
MSSQTAPRGAGAALRHGAEAALSRGAGAAPVVLVWIDSRSATIVRDSPDGIVLARVDSAVPRHRRSTGHVRIDPTVRHGGGGAPGDLVERERLEHRRAFLADVAARIPAHDDVVAMGPGTVREHLAAVLDADRRRQACGAVTLEVPSSRRTDRQLVARYRELVGRPPRRGVVPAR